MKVNDIMEKACLAAFMIVKNVKYESLDLALNRFRVLSLSTAYYEILSLNENIDFKEVYEELIIQCTEYDIKIKHLFN